MRDHLELYDAIVIGGAVAGSRTVELLAKNGKNVLMIEEHEKVGLPCKCTGLVSWRTPEMLNLPKQLIINKLDKGKFFAPDGTHFILKSKKPAYVLNRTGLDEFLFESAVKAGAKVKTERFETFNYNNNHVEVKTNKGIYKSKILIGADGANSIVARQANLPMPKNVLVGIQATASGDFEQAAEIWLGNNVAPKFFAWVVPENEEIARVGVGAPLSPREYYKRFLERRLNHNGLKPDVTGVIRFGVMKDTVADRIMLVGDAACQVKILSGGGITYGIIGAEICAEATDKALEQNKFDYQFFKQNYDAKWKKILLPGIRKGMLMRKIGCLLPDSQMNLLFKMIKLFGYKILNRLDFDLLSG